MLQNGQNQEAEWTGGIHAPVEPSSWVHGYVIYLKMFYDIRLKWEETTNPEKLQQLYRQMNKLEGVLVELENKNDISQRWTVDSEAYQMARDAANDRQKKVALLKVHSKVVERWFLLSLKAKYAEGHALAKRLSKQITQATNSMKTAVDEFNKLECSSSCSLPRSVEFDSVKNPDSDIWLQIDSLGSTSPIPITIKRKAVDLYNLVDRGKEEITLLQSEMKNTIDHFIEQHRIFVSSVVDEISLQSCSAETRGKDILIRMKTLAIESQLVELKELFEAHIEDISLPDFLYPPRRDVTGEEEEEEEDDSLYLSLPDRESDIDSDSDCADDVDGGLDEVEDDIDSAFF
ncbi:hypothetical protein OS493_035533 [Desmophyllum pertusum]|uniref:Uncharacterized protein n=1 Tax=Desmophyllum pertusum TaxID=174260 RepID=A0A9W9YIK2_9CNID|nr:hypothetical protein OS493_035533 [Desmophyllum pertusum]